MAVWRDGVLFPEGCEAFVGEGDAAFGDACEAGIEVLLGASSVSEAQQFYEERVAPREVERVRRAAVARADGRLELLFVTVGRQADAPALATVATPAGFVVLLHTDSCAEQAAEVCTRLGLSATEARLVSVGDGKDPVVVYRSIDRVWRERGEPPTVGVDLTGGFKTMSAAAASAAFAIPGAKPFYIDADQPRICGRSYWVRERRITMDNPFVVFGELRRREARSLLEAGHFVAAQRKFEELCFDRGEWSRGDECRALLAGAYAAIEALSFGVAVEKLETLEVRLRDWRRDPSVAPLGVMASSVASNLAGASALRQIIESTGKQDPSRDLDTLGSDAYREFLAFLIASAQRHRQQGALDVAALLAYRALEAICQRRLAVRGGVDPSNFDWDGFAQAAGRTVQELVDQHNAANRRSEHRLDVERLPRMVARTLAYALIRLAFPDDIGRDMETAAFGGLGESRNRSVLAHGFQKLEQRAANKLIDKADELLGRMLEIEGVGDDEQRALRARHAFAVAP